MAELFALEPVGKIYWDRKSFATFEEHVASLRGSKYLYIGNLSFYTTEAQIFELFSKVGPVKQVIMGLDRMKRTPCGFCFVEYMHSADATAAVNFIGGTNLDERVIRAELDPGFKEGRQFGRGASGGQVRDERRLEHDAARGGASARAQKYAEEKAANEQFAMASSSSSSHNTAAKAQSATATTTTAAAAAAATPNTTAAADVSSDMKTDAQQDATTATAAAAAGGAAAADEHDSTAAADEETSMDVEETLSGTKRSHTDATDAAVESETADVTGDDETAAKRTKLADEDLSDL